MGSMGPAHLTCMAGAFKLEKCWINQPLHPPFPPRQVPCAIQSLVSWSHLTEYWGFWQCMWRLLGWTISSIPESWVKQRQTWPTAVVFASKQTVHNKHASFCYLWWCLHETRKANMIIWHKWAISAFVFTIPLFTLPTLILQLYPFTPHRSSFLSHFSLHSTQYSNIIDSYENCSLTVELDSKSGGHPENRRAKICVQEAYWDVCSGAPCQGER